MRSYEKPANQRATMRRVAVTLLPIAVLALAAFFRLYKLDSVPPGLFRDEAINGLDILGIFQGRTPLLFADHEPIFIYLQALSLALLHQPELSLRLVSALFGVGTVGLTYLFANKLFDRWVALLAALGLASSYWDLDINRLALRANSLPFFILLSLYFLGVGLKQEPTPKDRRRGLWPFALSGAFLGLALYTYLAARVFPLVFVVVLVWLVVCRSLPWRQGLLMLLTSGAVALVIFAPLGFYVFSHPDILFNHTAETSFFANGPGRYTGPMSLFANSAKTLEMFIIRGDDNWRHNIPYQPVFNPITSAFFLTGLAYAFYRIRRFEYATVLAWLFVMLLPGMLSIESPHFLRTIGAAPPAYLVAAIGLVQVGRWLLRLAVRRRLSPKMVGGAYGMAVAGLVLATALTTFHDYFQVWATKPEVFGAFEGEISASARFLNTVQGEPLVLASGIILPHPSLLYLARPFADLLWYDSSQALVLPPPDLPRRLALMSSTGQSNREAVFIITGHQDLWLPKLQQVYPEGTVIGSGQQPDGETSFVAFRVPDLAKTGAGTEAPHPLKLNLDNRVEVEGYEIQGSGLIRGTVPTVRPGETLALTLYWKPLKPADQPELMFFNQFADSKLVNWGQSDTIGYDTSQWRGGELVLNRFEIQVPKNTPPGKYTLKSGLYSHRTMDRFPIFDSAGRNLGDVLPLLPVRVLPLKNEPPTPQNPSPAVLGETAQLLGYDLVSGQGSGADAKGLIHPGGQLRLTLFWKGLNATKDDYTVFIHMTAPSGEVVAQSDGQPAGGDLPTSLWSEGEYVTDSHDIALPATLASGEYTLSTGMYLLKTGERLAATKDGQPVADEVVLGKVRMETKG